MSEEIQHSKEVTSAELLQAIREVLHSWLASNLSALELGGSGDLETLARSLSQLVRASLLESEKL